MPQGSRRASHAGSWYTNDGEKLAKQLENWLHLATVTDNSARAVIVPHAGYSYSGETAAYSFKNLIGNTAVKRIFILGPSHHYYLSKCALTSMSYYETPIGNLTIDENVVNELYATGHFELMKRSVDEDEHSIEMQLPYIAKVMKGRKFTLVPILVGSLSKQSEELYGNLLSRYFDDPSNFFVISSDFCHWGKRFDYYYYDESHGPIYKSIEALDRMGMDAIESQDPKKFYSYRKEYKNTICGRHPIAVLMETIQCSATRCNIKFVKYAQSNQCESTNDSSVSYASAVISSISSASS